MNPRIETIGPKKLVGRRLTMSLSGNKTAELWKSFMPRREDLSNVLNKDVISMTIYPPSYFLEFSPDHEFEKWATMEVSDFDRVPGDMEAYNLEGGLYAVFDYKGSGRDNSIFQEIFGTWLPGSSYELDNRPHFEILGKKYKNNDPSSEEEIWIPVKPKGELAE